MTEDKRLEILRFAERGLTTNEIRAATGYPASRVAAVLAEAGVAAAVIRNGREAAVRFDTPDDELRARWRGLIGPMKERLRASI